MKARAVIFDLDGTLIDSVPDIHVAVNKMLAEMGRETLSLATVTSFVGNGILKLVELCLDATGGSARVYNDALARFRVHYAAAPAVLTRAYPGVPGLLAALKAEGRAIGLCTNKPVAPSEDILTALGLAGHVDVIVGGDSLPELKPDPAPLLHCLERLGATRAEAVFVGDSEIDAATAAAAETRFALYSGGYRKGPLEDIRADLVFDDFDALMAML